MANKVTFSTVRPGQSSADVESTEMDGAEAPQSEAPEFIGMEVRPARDGRGWVVSEHYSNAKTRHAKYADNSALADCLITTGQEMKRDAAEDDSEPSAESVAAQAGGQRKGGGY